MSEWKDVWEMLEDIAEHVSQTGDSILPADVPPKVIYQSCADVEKTWKISSANVKASFKRLVGAPPVGGERGAREAILGSEKSESGLSTRLLEKVRASTVWPEAYYQGTHSGVWHSFESGSFFSCFKQV